MGRHDRNNVKYVVAIPAKDEEQIVGSCLQPLINQSGATCDIVLFINNTTDQTAAVARTFVGKCETTVHIREVSLPPGQANAGTVRRLAMDWAAGIAGAEGIILTTDADGRDPHDWISRNVAWLREGHDAVCGMAAIDPADEVLIPTDLIADDIAETTYTALLDEIDHWLDPDPGTGVRATLNARAPASLSERPFTRQSAAYLMSVIARIVGS